MADQTIRIESMPDDSDSRVAFDIWRNLQWALPSKEGFDAIEQELKLFDVCRKVVRGGGVDLSKLRA